MMLTTANYATLGQKVNAMTQNVNSVQTDLKNPVSHFRMWVNNIWIQNCEEHLTYRENPYTIKEYWNRNKWFLKHLYKHQKDSNVSR